jgi:hypothetical protein
MKVNGGRSGRNHTPSRAGHPGSARRRGAALLKRKLRVPLTAQEKAHHDEYLWARQSATIRRQYAGKVIAVRDRKVVAVGKTAAALQAKLQRGKKFAREELVIVPIAVN